MISWLKGLIMNNWQTSSKTGVVINVGGVGYEVQILSRQLNKINALNEQEIWIHHILREDSSTLYGFRERDQRDLFRRIIAVNGIGPQIGMGLLEDNEVNDLVKAIEENDLILLTKSQGIGKRIAERLVLDLKNKLHEFKVNKLISTSSYEHIDCNPINKYFEEINSTLNSLGYLDNEIKESIELIKTKEINLNFLNTLSSESKNELMDKHLKDILINLSEQST
tara:strand:- start:1783 stop:2454 length:672 start_codon:yes stop_codon:yes gene_type:complete